METRSAPARAVQCARAVGRFAVLSVSLFAVPAAATTTLGTVSSSSIQPPSFAATKNYRVGRNPAAVAIGDLNGDRKPDLAVANSEDPSISVLMNRGDGSFRAARNFPTGTENDVPGVVAIGNLTGDSKPDLAVSNGASTGRGVIVLTNKGGGTFRAERRFLPNIHPAAVAIADLNGDKILDLIAVRFGVDAVSVLLNKAGGRFAANVDYGTGAGPTSVAIGDLTGDHKPDLVTGNENANTVSLLVNKGDGRFESKRDSRTGRNPTAVAIGDLNADGKPDVAVSNNWSRTISLLTNGGEGRFEPRRDFPTAGGPDGVTIADLNGDRRPDLATTAPLRNSVSILVNRGDGKFEPRLDYAAGGSPSTSSLERGDLNGDGKVDLATAYDDPVDGVGVLLARPGLCTVQDVRLVTVKDAKRMLARANCRLGKIRRAYSNRVQKGLVLSQKPKPGTVLPKFGKVDVRVSRGRKQ
jgi:predicted NUDIX family NTP pyrophosphohydrolase